MSTWTDYEDKASTRYDKTRIAAGVELLEGTIRHHSPVPFEQSHVLALSCGTGNYEKVLLDAGIGHITCTDASLAMLSQAKLKLENSRADFKQVVLPKISYEDEKFDVVTYFMALHHVLKYDEDSGEVTDWSPAQKIFDEAYRCLKKGGIFIFNWSTRDQLFSYYYGHLVPEAMVKGSKRFTDIEDMLEWGEKANFEVVSKFKIIDPLQHGYYDYEKSAKSEDFWYQDSVLSGKDAEAELPEARKILQEKLANGTWADWCKQHCKVDTIGSAVQICFRKK